MMPKTIKPSANIAVLASGNGTNFAAIARAVKRGYIRAKLKLVLTDKNNAYVRIRAKKFRVKDMFVNPSDFKSRLEFDRKITGILKKEKIDLVVLAGFMQILTPYFIRKFQNRILNIHPAILPAFRGEKAIERAYKYGCKVTGVTVHFVDEQVDHGSVILQKPIEIKNNMSLIELNKNIHRLEHKLYPLAIKLFIEKKLKKTGRYVKVI